MPIYAFRCGACEQEFDHLQRLADPDPVACPHCGAHALQRLVSAPAFRLAGTGWYETDFKGKNEHRHNLADGPAASTPKTEAPAGGGSTADGAGAT